MINPIQRIPRYVILLEQLLDATPQYHVEYGDILAALSAFKKIASEINENKRRTEISRQLVAVQMCVYGLKENLVDKEDRQLIREGEVEINMNRNYQNKGIFSPVQHRKYTNYYVFLFNDKLMYCRRKKKGQFLFQFVYENEIPLADTKIGKKKSKRGKIYSFFVNA